MGNLVGISISWAPGTGYYLPVRCPEGSQALECDAVLKALKPILEDPKDTFYGDRRYGAEEIPKDISGYFAQEISKRSKPKKAAKKKGLIA